MADIDSLHLLSGAYAVDALDPAERAAFETHLATCPDCTEEVAGLQATAARLGSAEAVRPPDRMKAAVMAAVATTRQLGPEPTTDGQGWRSATTAGLDDAGTANAAAAADEPDGSGTGGVVVPLRARRRTVQLLAAAAAFLAVLALGLGVLLSQARSQRAQTLADAKAVTSVLTASDARTLPGQVAGGGRAAVVVSPSQNEAVLVGDDLSAPPAGHVYQLWYIGAGGHATSAGTFTPNSSGFAAQPLQGSPSGAAAVGMTVEPAGGSPQPTTTPVMAVQLST